MHYGNSDKTNADMGGQMPQKDEEFHIVLREDESRRLHLFLMVFDSHFDKS